MKVLLETKNLTKNFGGLAAVQGVNLTVNQGEVLGLIGPNGSGKTTFFNLVTGFLHSSEGSIIFDGNDITKLAPHKIAKKGIVRSFQLVDLIRSRTALENVSLAFYMHTGIGFWEAWFHTPGSSAKEKRILANATELLDFVGMANMKDELAGNLPVGYRKLLSIAMGLAASPKLLLLDEPTAGMSAEETANTVNQLGKVRDRGVTMMVVEHDMKVVMGFSNRIVVLNYGRKIAEGSPSEIKANREVIAAYLGTKKGA